jgi:hypothetical protein
VRWSTNGVHSAAPSTTGAGCPVACQGPPPPAAARADTAASRAEPQPAADPGLWTNRASRHSTSELVHIEGAGCRISIRPGS